ncbi:MAG: hypothetical protein ABMA64_05070 [Myxococcota bacterium]
MTEPLRMMVTCEPTPTSRELVRGHLYLTLGKESDGSYVAAAPEEVADAGPTDDAFRLAMSILRQTTARADLHAIETLPGIHLLVAQDGLAASRMVLVPELMGNAFGGVVVAVPAPDQLLVVPLNSARALDALHILASALSYALDAADEPLSDQLFWFDGTRWTALPVVHGEDEVTVVPPAAFVGVMNRLASMDLVQVVAES